MGKSKLDELVWYTGSGGSRTPKGRFVALAPSGGISISPELTARIDPEKTGACRLAHLTDPERLILQPSSRQSPGALCWASKTAAGKTFRLAGAGVLRAYGLKPKQPMRYDAEWVDGLIVVTLATGAAQAQRLSPPKKPPAAKPAAAAPAAEVGKAVCSDCDREVSVYRVGKRWVMEAHNDPEKVPCDGRPMRIRRA